MYYELLLCSWRSMSVEGASYVRFREPKTLCEEELVEKCYPCWHVKAINNSFGLSITTAFSTFPFDCEYPGLDVRCSNCRWEEKFLNSWLSNSWQLSVISTSGILWRANYTLSWVKTACAVFLWISITLKKLDQWSTIIRNVCWPRTNRSVAIFCQGCDWSSCAVEALQEPVLVGVFGRLYKVSHSRPIQYFTDTENAFSDVNVTAVELV